MKLKNLLIVSDTQIHFSNGEYHAFNSVVNELNVFLEIFSTITWIGYNFSDKPIDETLLKISQPNVRVVLLPRSGGTSFLSKLRICKNIFFYTQTIVREARNADFVHSRGPSVPMLLALVVSFLCKKPKWWFKYANNWSDPKPPFFWKVQQRLMCKNTATVGTINGNWEGLPSHIFPFENPCLQNKNGKTKVLTPRTEWRLLFVGRMEVKKGFGLILDAMDHLPIQKIESITFIGDGKDMNLLQEKARKYKNLVNIIIHGNLPKDKVFSEMHNADFLLLPSTASEGFPKVIAEAWYNGCLPVVSSVSCVGQYVINGVNGFVWDMATDKLYMEVLKEALLVNEEEYEKLLEGGYEMCRRFTYSHYLKMIREKLLVGYN